MKRTLLAGAVAAMAIATGARAQNLSHYPIRDENDRVAYDGLATSWDSDSPTARQCALDRLEERHITKTYLNLLKAFNSCLQKEIDEQQATP
jgi:hypothetical protein